MLSMKVRMACMYVAKLAVSVLCLQANPMHVPYVPLAVLAGWAHQVMHHAACTVLAAAAQSCIACMSQHAWMLVPSTAAWHYRCSHSDHHDEDGRLLVSHEAPITFSVSC